MNKLFKWLKLGLISILSVGMMAGCTLPLGNSSSSDSSSEDSSYSSSEDSSDSSSEDSSDSSSEDSSDSSSEDSSDSSSEDSSNSSSEDSSDSSSEDSSDSSSDGNGDVDVTPTEFTPVFRFIVASDMHISATGTDSAMTKDRFADMLEQMYGYANAQAYAGLDAILLAGDITDYGTQADLTVVKQIIDANKSADTELVITMGNHDFWGNKSNPAAMIAQFESFFGDVNAHVEIGGYHFITLCADGGAVEPGWDYTDTVVEYARTEIAKAYAAVGPNEPIFVVQHVGNSNTCAGTCSHTNISGNNAVDTLDAILAQYPNVVSFAGHSHFACNDECAIHQRDYTSIATGGLYYSTRLMLNASSIDMENRYEMAQNYVVEMDANHVMRVRCWDVLQEKFVGETWTISSWSKSDFVYTEDRFSADDLFFAEDAAITIDEVDAYSATISFDPVPQESLTARAYKVVVKGSADNVVFERYISKDFFNEVTEPIEVEIANLRPETTYAVEVVALNSLYCSELSEEEWIQKPCSTLLKSVPLTTALTTTEYGGKPTDEVLAFNTEEDIASITATTGVTLSWAESAHGVDGGLLKVSYTGSKNVSLKMDLTELTPFYEDYDWLVVRARFVKDISESKSEVMTLCGKTADYFDNWVYHDAWRNYVYKISSLTEAQVKDLQLKIANATTNSGELWIDEIYLMKDVSKADVRMEVDGALLEGQTIAFNLVNPSKAAIKQIIVKDPDGLVVEDLTAVEAKYGQYVATITLVSGYHADDTRDALYYGGRDTELAFVFTVEEMDKTLSVEFGDHIIIDNGENKLVTLPSYTVTRNGQALTPDSVEITVTIKNTALNEIEVVDNQFTTTLNGAIYRVEYEFTVEGTTEHFYYEIEIERPETQAKHSIFDAEYAIDLENFYTDENSIATYVQDVGYVKYAGGGSNDIPMTGGIIKVDYVGTTSPWFSFKPAHSMDTYKDYNYIIFHVWCVESTNKITSIKPGVGSDCIYFGNGDHKTAWTDTSAYYFTYVFEISAFLDAWTDGDLDTAVAKVQLIAKGKGAGTYYISSIYAAKSIDNSTLNVKVNGTEFTSQTQVKAGDTISMYNPDNYGDIAMYVNGVEMTEFTAEDGKTYTITFKHINRVDSDYYYLRYNNGGCYSNGGQVKTVTIIIP